MGKVIAGITLSADGFGAGPDQSLDNPLGVGGRGLHGWFYPTKTFQSMIGKSGGTEGADNDFGARGLAGFGAYIMGRNMFAPMRGPWPDPAWNGWWGENPPYHAPTFVLTHHPRADLPMQGGTTFHFETGGIHAALDRAQTAAKGKDVRISGGVSTMRQYLEAGLIDEIHLAYSPVFLGKGESLLAGLDLPALGFAVTERVLTENAMHVVLTRTV